LHLPIYQTPKCLGNIFCIWADVHPLQKVYTLVSKQQQITQYLGAGTQTIDDMIKTAKQAIAPPYKNTAPPYSPLADRKNRCVGF